MRLTMVVAIGSAFVFAGLAVAPLLDKFVFPEPEPSEEYYPAAGQVFRSRSEGFTQRILRRDDRHLWIETVLDPHAAGPPAHIHPKFAETFEVTEGSVSVLIGDRVTVLSAGQKMTVAGGIAHKPFNATGKKAVMRSPLTPGAALPIRFGVFLTQMYGYTNESDANNRPPRILLQMARFSPAYNTWLAKPPILIQRTLYFILSPWARLLGYRDYYPRFAPGREIR